MSTVSTSVIRNVETLGRYLSPQQVKQLKIMRDGNKPIKYNLLHILTLKDNKCLKKRNQ